MNNYFYIMKLYKKISINLYYELYTRIYNFQCSCHFYCFCDQIPGGDNEFGQRFCCLICQFYLNYDLEDLEKVKKMFQGSFYFIKK